MQAAGQPGARHVVGGGQVLQWNRCVCAHLPVHHVTWKACPEALRISVLAWSGRRQECAEGAAGPQPNGRRSRRGSAVQLGAVSEEKECSAQTNP